MTFSLLQPELGFPHPQPALRVVIFAGADIASLGAILRELGCAAHEAVMVSSDYGADVAGAKSAGLTAIWFNPGTLPCPDAHPQHDAELLAMADLPGLLARPRLPDLPACAALLAKYRVAANILAHVRAVAAVAFRLAERLRAAGEMVDPLLAHRGGLLHDVAKIAAQGSPQGHDDLAGQILRELGQPELAAIAERHTVWAVIDPAKRPDTWEQKLVFFADRIVVEDFPQGVEARMVDMQRRRPEIGERLDAYLPPVLALEAEIAWRLALTPREMLRWIQAMMSARI